MELIAPSNSSIINKVTKIAICFHLFYQEMFQQFSQYIENILECQYDTDIYITYQQHSQIIERIKETYPNVILIMSNRGCDTGAFLLQMKKMYESGKQYDYIFKFHTKKMPIWRAQLLDAIAGSPQAIKSVINDFK